MDNELEGGTDTEAKQEMNKILAELKKKMQEIDEMTKELAKERSKLKDEKTDTKKTKKILEEIKVPSLELLK